MKFEISSTDYEGDRFIAEYGSKLSSFNLRFETRLEESPKFKYVPGSSPGSQRKVFDGTETDEVTELFVDISDLDALFNLSEVCGSEVVIGSNTYGQKYIRIHDNYE